MTDILVPSDASAGSLPVWFVTSANHASVLERLGESARTLAETSGFAPKAGRHLFVPGPDGALAHVLFGADPDESGSHAVSDRFLSGRLPDLLPAGTYRFANDPGDSRLAAMAFALGSYRFTRYRKGETKDVRLVVPDGVDHAELARIVHGVALARDLINTPANDLGPAELEQAAGALADRHGARMRCVVGDALLAENFPLIHAVGRASDRAPRLIDISYGDPSAPRVTLVGKGVCFDTGGLDLKPSSAMLLMKKDMAGAASALAAAHMIMDRGLDVRLRVLIPAVENAVSGSAFRPLDVIRSRQGQTVEIGNTDAEGRLILADALALAAEESPEILIDMGTLTGAARVALGPDLPPFYTDDEPLAEALARCAMEENDPLWRMPLWRPYSSMLSSKVADTNNVSSGAFAGSVTCALFLARFVSGAKSWVHLDVYGWTPNAKPGRPEGGECQGARAIYALLCERYG